MYKVIWFENVRRETDDGLLIGSLQKERTFDDKDEAVSFIRKLGTTAILDKID